MPDDGNNFRIGGAALFDTASMLRLSQTQSRLEKVARQEKPSVAGSLEKGGRAGGANPENLKAATEFEALLLQQMLQSMWTSVPKDGLLASNEEATYRDMFNEAMAKEIAEGQGIGVKDVILREIERAEKK